VLARGGFLRCSESPNFYRTVGAEWFSIHGQRSGAIKCILQFGAVIAYGVCIVDQNRGGNTGVDHGGLSPGPNASGTPDRHRFAGGNHGAFRPSARSINSTCTSAALKGDAVLASKITGFPALRRWMTCTLAMMVCGCCLPDAHGEYSLLRHFQAGRFLFHIAGC